ncbi:hypothetical protein HZC31_04145 [Candidatus Woesearchaeota archaeon]|nr:hypothetical protein [Candidatus Woesearchaeota archaeon]
MEKRNVAYLIVFLLLFLSLIVSLVYISLLKDTLYRQRTFNSINEDILQAELSGLYETQLQEDGFYVSPTLVGDASTGVNGVIHFYNFFDTPKTFSFQLISGSTTDFPYDSLEIVALSSEVIDPGEESNAFFVFQIIDEDSFLQRRESGQYTVQIIVDGEVIGEDTLEVIVVN